MVKGFSEILLLIIETSSGYGHTHGEQLEMIETENRKITLSRYCACTSTVHFSG